MAIMARLREGSLQLQGAEINANQPRFIQNLLAILKDVGILRAIYHRLANDRIAAKHQLGDGIFPKFSDALAAVPPGRKVGYNHREMAIYNEHMADAVLTSDYAVAYWLRGILRERISIFDLGGNVGVAYYALGKIVQYPSGMKWLVCDLPEINRRGMELASSRDQRGALSFTSSYQDADRHDVLTTIGALQYIDVDLAAILAGLTSPPPHLLISRIPLTERATYVTLQDLGPAVCAYRIFNRQEFVGSLARLGYRVINQWECPEGFCRVRYHPQTTISSFSGLYLRRDGR